MAAFRRILATESRPTHVTKVLKNTQVLRTAVSCLALCAWPVLGMCAPFPAAKPAEALYLELGKVGLDPARVYQVRGASLDRSSIQISLDDGTIAFARDVMGRITAAFFQGDGEILLTPPTAVERKSMSFFTGMPILEERFETAYFRFNDDAFEQLRPDLRDTNDKEEFVQRWDSTAKNLAGGDAMRLLVSFSQMLPVTGTASSGAPAPAASTADRFLHARLQGAKLGVFDVFFDSTTVEQVQAGQARNSDNGGMYYDVWTSFAPLQTKGLTAAAEGPEAKKEKTHGGRISVRGYTIRTEVLPPKQIHARARLQCDVREGGSRTLLFELSRFLQIESVTLDGNPVEFIHNPAIEGTQLSRRGNDIVAVVLPEPARSQQKFELDFAYAGEVLAEAGSGLLYVGERGTWYPNRGMEMANFDLQFTYPQGWTVVATGKPAEVVPDPAGKVGEGQTSRWVSERPIPLAGFNLGKYREATTRVGEVTVETYATVGVERNFPSGEIEVIEPMQPDPGKRRQEVITPATPSPARNEVRVGEAAARAIQYFSDRFGPFPYSHLALTQMPGNESQGWPGLIFLSSYAFLTDAERKQLHYEELRILLQHLLPAHETAHQWWGDLVTWSSYRDQWFSEGLAHYCALMMLEEKNPEGFRALMEDYRHELVEKNKDGLSPMDAGPVTLGTRLLSSRAPFGYEAINYGRGAWLFHMLRTMLKDGARESARGAQAAAGGEEPFVRALRKLRQQYEGKAITTTELLEAFAEELPPSLRYEGKRSLDWFLEGWVNGTSLPRLELKGVRFSPRGTGFVVSGAILQKGAPQELVTSVPLYGVRAGKQPIFLGRVFADGDESPFRLSAPAGTRKVLIDPYETLLTAPKQ